VARTFVVARNPDPESSLPYLVRLPLGDEPLVLKARETWPRTSKVYCHRAEEGWPTDPDVVEEVPVRSCARRGTAVDLVLARARENRSQIVFTQLRGGREAIFWQTATTVRQARPGLRVPSKRRASGIVTLEVLVDTRERYPYKFSGVPVTTRRHALPAGDYAVEHEGTIVASVERKSVADLAASLVSGGLPFALAEMSALYRAAVVVEAPYSRLYKLEFVTSGFVPELLAKVQVRYPSVPIVFCDTRALAEQWTFRFLGAAVAEFTTEQARPPH
jgi:hypothetical protein